MGTDGILMECLPASPHAGVHSHTCLLPMSVSVVSRRSKTPPASLCRRPRTSRQPASSCSTCSLMDSTASRGRVRPRMQSVAFCKYTSTLSDPPAPRTLTLLASPPALATPDASLVPGTARCGRWGSLDTRTILSTSAVGEASTRVARTRYASPVDATLMTSDCLPPHLNCLPPRSDDV